VALGQNEVSVPVFDGDWLGALVTRTLMRVLAGNVRGRVERRVAEGERGYVSRRRRVEPDGSLCSA
jgi:hypothetical protein